MAINLGEVSRRARLARNRNATRAEAIRESFEISDVAGDILGLAFVREVTGCSLADAKEWRKQRPPPETRTILKPRCDKHDEDRPPLAECCEGCVNDGIRDTAEVNRWSTTVDLANWLLGLAGDAFGSGDDAKAKILRDLGNIQRRRAGELREAYDKRKKGEVKP